MSYSATDANFSEEDYFEQTFEALDRKGSLVEGKQFENCIFKKCNFSGTDFRRCRFLDCTFEHCDMSNLKVQGASFRSNLFKDCKMVGFNWSHTSSVSHLNFEKCRLDFSVFAGLDLRKSSLLHCVAKEADFSETNLSETDCRGTDFSGARFANSNLTKADFRQAINYSIRPGENKLKKARFSLPEATLLLYGLDIVLEE
jgi:uncharacterized protein YjbI with pentapeptide repeats